MKQKDYNDDFDSYIYIFEINPITNTIQTKTVKISDLKDSKIDDNKNSEFSSEEKTISPASQIFSNFTNWLKNEKRTPNKFETFAEEEAEFKYRTAEEYEAADFSSDRAAIKHIKNIRKKRISIEKKMFKQRIKNELNHDLIKDLKISYKNKFKYGLESNTNDNIIEIRNLNKYYVNSKRFEKVLKDINLEIPRGKFILILGPSGSGKTTLLNTISGLDTFNSGDLISADRNLFYLNDNKRIEFRANNLSFIFQSYNLISTLTVEENIKIGENLRRKDADEIPLKEILINLGLEEQAKKYPFQLSGGQQQRVSIARALAKNPSILFADEPTGALDEERGKETMKLLMNINEKYKTTLIIVTHNPNFEDIADIIIRVKDGQISEYKINKNPTKDINEIKWG